MFKDNHENWALCENKNRKDDKLLIGQYDQLIFEGRSEKLNNNKSE